MVLQNEGGAHGLRVKVVVGYLVCCLLPKKDRNSKDLAKLKHAHPSLMMADRYPFVYRTLPTVDDRQ
jgi:hypothetical protein